MDTHFNIYSNVALVQREVGTRKEAGPQVSLRLDPDPVRLNVQTSLIKAMAQHTKRNIVSIPLRSVPSFLRTRLL